jgi:putative ABC transport system ATP-binding protein
MDLLATAARAPGRCVVIVTHDPRTYAYADRLTEMEDGRVAAVHHGDALKSFIQSHH